MVVIYGEKCDVCSKKFVGGVNVASYDIGDAVYYAHINCLSVCTMPSCQVKILPSIYHTNFKILRETARTGNKLLRAAFYALNGPSYEAYSSLPYGFSHPVTNKSLNYPHANLDERALICGICNTKDNEQKKLDERLKAEEIRRQAVQAKKLKMERQKEAEELIASEIHELLVELYVSAIIPKHILLLITKFFPNTEGDESLATLLVSILASPPATQNEKWSNIEYWKKQFEVISTLSDIAKEQDIHLQKLIICAISTSNYINYFLSFGHSEVVNIRIDNITKWAKNPEKRCIFDGIFYEPQKITYDGALELLENGFDSQPEALMEVIEGGRHWEVVAVKYGFYQL